jgi:hypothetical protein
VEPTVVDSFRLIEQEPEIIECVGLAQEDPEVAAELSKGLAEAKDDEDVAAAVVNARAVSKFKEAGEEAGPER